MFCVCHFDSLSIVASTLASPDMQVEPRRLVAEPTEKLHPLRGLKEVGVTQPSCANGKDVSGS
jgi:hypothetical protein